MLPSASLVPPPVRAVLRAVRQAGFDSWLVGGCVRDALRGAPVDDFDVATSATPDVVLELFPRAVPIGLRHGTVMVPTPTGPVDVTSFRGGPRLEDDLALRDFTINAMAWDPEANRLVDPFGGAADLARGRLRAVGAAVDRFAEDPVRALRAARLVGSLGLVVDPEVERAMSGARQGLRNVARERIRHELEVLLVSPRAGAGLALLRATGIEADWAPRAAVDAPAVLDRLPPELTLRTAAWLRGARVQTVLSRLRVGRRGIERVTKLLAFHPIDRRPPEHDADVRRLLRRAGPERVTALLALRRAEIDAAAPRDPEAARRAAERLEDWKRAIERVKRSGSVALRRSDLALAGKDVMRLLRVGPGPEVGAALRYLLDCVVEDPACNRPDRLAARLEAWREARRTNDRSARDDVASGSPEAS